MQIVKCQYEEVYVIKHNFAFAPLPLQHIQGIEPGQVQGEDISVALGWTSRYALETVTELRKTSCRRTAGLDKPVQ